MPLDKIFMDLSACHSYTFARQLEQYSCCQELNDDNFSFINSEIKKRLTELKIRYYRQLAPPNLPND